MIRLDDKLGESESRQLVAHLERMIIDGEKMLADPAKYGLDNDDKLRDGILLMVNQLRHKKEACEDELKKLKQ